MQSLFGLIAFVSSVHRAAHVRAHNAMRARRSCSPEDEGWGLLSRSSLHRSPTLVRDTVNRYFISDPHHLSAAERQETRRRPEDVHYLKDHSLKNTTHRWFLPAHSTDGTFR